MEREKRQSENNHVLKLSGLTWNYPGKKEPALKDFTYSFQQGLYGILGPNGAGKSTLLRLITASVPTQKGKVLWDERTVTMRSHWFYRNLGYAPQQHCFYPEFTGRQMLEYLYDLKQMPKSQKSEAVKTSAAAVNLLDRLDEPLSSYSGGMRQRMLLAQAFLGMPALIVLDEPSAGLDPEERVRLRTFSKAAADAGSMVLFSTHVVSDIECVADRVLLMRKGSLVESGTPQELLNRTKCTSLEEVYLTYIGEKDTCLR